MSLAVVSSVIISTVLSNCLLYIQSVATDGRRCKWRCVGGQNNREWLNHLLQPGGDS